MAKKLIVIVGPTGIGKTDLSINIASYFKTDILSSDSRQFYKELSIGTAVPNLEQLNTIQHHFIQHLSIHDYYNASMFEMDSLKLLSSLFETKNYVLLVGGSGMYIDAVCKGIDDIPDIDIEIRNSLIDRMEAEGIESLRFELKKLDPDFYNLVDLKNKQRVLRALEVCLQTGKSYSSFRTHLLRERNFKIVKIGLTMNRDELYQRINLRVDQMIEQGLVEEARSMFPNKHLNSLKTVGYRELFDYFEGKQSFEKAIELIKRNSRHYAKRQLSWFNRDKEINWFNPSQFEEIVKCIE